MSTTLAKWMTLIITANIMFAPILAYLDSLHREAVEVVLQEGAKKAAIEGRFTDTLINEMKQELVDNYNFDADKITITATKNLTYRENFIEATIEVPRGPIFIFEIFNNGPSTIKKSTKILSEYI
ncbi:MULTISPECIES: hypothetical protein [Metabacillus]|uniref:hypothetical protein n=1 Tax=Metabacillus TaxID=2675233 RepID=UPI000C7FB946|nr:MULTISPECIES: hypothetical protein [Metabacillus]MCM3443570.1 hypothetical protein [Metabacillus halosaccharovorans]PMC34264.1 hypothetical protein CJ195_24425 [Bacillus sp. UMB0899]